MATMAEAMPPPTFWATLTCAVFRDAAARGRNQAPPFLGKLLADAFARTGGILGGLRRGRVGKFG